MMIEDATHEECCCTQEGLVPQKDGDIDREMKTYSQTDTQK